MYGNEPPQRLKISDLLLLDACAASGGPRTQMFTVHLDRWKVVYEAIAEWYRSDDPDEVAVAAIVDRIMGWMDPVQRQIAEDLFATYRQLLPKRTDEEIDLDPPPSEVPDVATNASLSVATQYGVDNGTELEVIKLKTGRGVSDEEKAVLVDGAEDPSVRFLEVRLRNGEVDELEMAPEIRRAIIERLFAIPGRVRQSGSAGTTPGLHCFTCSRPARCGQYPTLDGRQSNPSFGAGLAHRASRAHRCLPWLLVVCDDGHGTEAGDRMMPGGNVTRAGTRVIETHLNDGTAIVSGAVVPGAALTLPENVQVASRPVLRTGRRLLGLFLTGSSSTAAG